MGYGQIITYAGRPTAGVTHTLVGKAVEYTQKVLNVYYLNDETHPDRFLKFADLDKAGPGRLVFSLPKSRKMEDMIADIRLSEAERKTMFQVVIFDLVLPRMIREESPYNIYRDSADKILRFSREDGRIVLISYRVRQSDKSETLIDNIDLDLAMNSDEIYWVKKTYNPEPKIELERIK